MSSEYWAVLAPFGELPHKSAGVIQVIGWPEMKDVIDAFQAQVDADPNFPGVLLDYDHASEGSDKGTAAAGWIEALTAETDGLRGLISWTKDGAESVAGLQIDDV